MEIFFVLHNSRKPVLCIYPLISQFLSILLERNILFMIIGWTFGFASGWLFMFWRGWPRCNPELDSLDRHSAWLQPKRYDMIWNWTLSISDGDDWILPFSPVRFYSFISISEKHSWHPAIDSNKACKRECPQTLFNLVFSCTKADSLIGSVFHVTSSTDTSPITKIDVISRPFTLSVPQLQLPSQSIASPTTHLHTPSSPSTTRLLLKESNLWFVFRFLPSTCTKDGHFPALARRCQRTNV